MALLFLDYKMEVIQSKLIDLIKRLSKHISNYRKIQLTFLLFLMLITSFFEMISIGLALPFLGIITDTEKTFENEKLKPIINYLNISNAVNLFYLLLFPLVWRQHWQGYSDYYFYGIRLNFRK